MPSDARVGQVEMTVKCEDGFHKSCDGEASYWPMLSRAPKVKPCECPCHGDA